MTRTVVCLALLCSCGSAQRPEKPVAAGVEGGSYATAATGSGAPDDGEPLREPTAARADYGPGPDAVDEVASAPRAADRAAAGGRAEGRSFHGAREMAKSAKPRAAKRAPEFDRGAPAGTPYVRPRPVAAPALRAGRHDDNNQYNRFLSFLGANSPLIVYPVDVGERLVLRTVDEDGKSLHNCAVDVLNQAGKVLASSTTYADGRTMFFPGDAATAGDNDFAVRARCGNDVRNGQLARSGRRETEIRFNSRRKIPRPVPVDIAIVLDTTGSMQSQIDRLKKTLQAIHFQLTQLSTKPDIRFALVAYRDHGDDYVTQVSGFTGDIRSFQDVLDGLDADGGGDTPEDLQSALDKAMHELRWRKDALRLGFVVADAIPHTDYGQEYSYRSAMREGLVRGIKWTTVGAGGLPRSGEVIFRQLAQLTMGEYVFVTQSGAGNREGGAGEASHHVGSNYSSENLDQAIIRIVRRELSYLTDEPKDFDYTIVAKGDHKTPKEDILAPAVHEVLRQLVDYSSLRLEAHTPVAIVPVATNDDSYKDVAGYLADEMTLAASRNPALRVIERDLNAVADEIKIQLSDLFDVTEAVPIGNMVGAEILIVAKLTVHGDKAELFAKLIRVETGEMLSVAKADLVGGVVHTS